MCNCHSRPLNGHECDDTCRCYWIIKWIVAHIRSTHRAIEHEIKKNHFESFVTKSNESIQPSFNRHHSLSLNLLHHSLSALVFFLSLILLLLLLSTNCCFLPAYHHLNCNHMFLQIHMLAPIDLSPPSTPPPRRHPRCTSVHAQHTYLIPSD